MASLKSNTGAWKIYDDPGTSCYVKVRKNLRNTGKYQNDIRVCLKVLPLTKYGAKDSENFNSNINRIEQNNTKY